MGADSDDNFDSFLKHALFQPEKSRLSDERAALRDSLRRLDKFDTSSERADRSELASTLTSNSLSSRLRGGRVRSAAAGRPIRLDPDGTARAPLEPRLEPRERAPPSFRPDPDEDEDRWEQIAEAVAKGRASEQLRSALDHSAERSVLEEREPERRAARARSAERDRRPDARRPERDRALALRSRLEARNERPSESLTEGIASGGAYDTNFRRRVDRIADGLVKVHSLLGDQEVHVADDISRVRDEVRELQDDLADSRDVMREREKATERTLTEFRSYLEGYARRQDTHLIALQSTVDQLSKKVDSLTRSVGYLEHEILG